MKTSENISELAEALAKAQGVIEGAVRGNVNPAFRSRYADLGAVWDAIRAPLSSAGIAVVQALGASDGRITCTTRLLKGAQWIESELVLPVGKQDAQGYGSAATYARRYALMAMVGIAPIDDDGNAAVGSDAAHKKRAPGHDEGPPVRRHAAPAATAALPAYPQERWDQSIEAWRTRVAAGIHPDAIVRTIATKYTLSDEQLAAIHALAQPTTEETDDGQR